MEKEQSISMIENLTKEKDEAFEALKEERKKITDLSEQVCFMNLVLARSNSISKSECMFAVCNG